ncbi:helix-turn-helix domain-containing protein [Thiomicrorhabdus aquaedulcis]|uniref:helix-turn-helix domain-containing protein n=1 Tax=Thiomicrorhabdus aquaedulcis TaxID=2211106 RepID=UPI000FDA96B3|nr:helix-turn-helix domain-containing protein [Thiomicrorhabdus aquaedulcis]
MSNQECMTMQPLNEILQNARIERGLTIEAVAQQLNLSLEQVAQMESDTIQPALISPFERGYIRNYAALLDIDKSVYEPYFPDVIAVSSELLSTKRFNYPAKKVLIGSKLFKGILWLAFLLGLLWIGMTYWPGLVEVEQAVDALQVHEFLPLKSE